MASNHAKIWAAVRDHLETYSGLPNDVVYGGEVFDDPSPLEPYLIVDDLRFDPQRTYFTGADWHTGSLMIHCMVPLNWTYAQSIEYAGLIAAHFPDDTEMTFQDVSLRVARYPAISGAGYRDGSHYRVPVSVPWEGRA